MWPAVEPLTPYVHGWHIDAMSDHLEAVTRNDINRLLINVPFGMMKSLEVGVFWPAWEWGPCNMPGLRYIGTSYRGDYADRDSRKMRDLVLSPLYQKHWGNRVQLERGGETSFSNTQKGSRESIPFTSLTGGRGDRLIIDDPHSTEQAESDTERGRAVRIFRESVPSRVNDIQRSAIVIVMQRLHENDVSGVALALSLGYTHLMLPMEYEPKRKCITYVMGKKFFEDPRTHEGELLFPERFPRAEVEKLKIALGSYAAAGQMQQNPVPRQGKMFQRAWFEPVPTAPADTRWVRWWDLADTDEQLSADPDYTAGLKLGYSPTTKMYYIGNVLRARKESPEIRRLMKTTAALDGYDCVIGFPQDPGGAGKGRAKDLVRMLAGYNVHYERESGSKIVRADPVQSQAEAGFIKLVVGADMNRPGWTLPEWVEPFLAEIEKFPSGAHKDQVDALANAFNMLNGDAVFNALEANIITEPVRIAGHWARAFAFDLDRDRFGAVWAAWDRQADVVYLYDEYRVGRADLAIHKEGMVKRGSWIPGLFDMNGRGRKKDESVRIAERLADQLNLFTIEVDEEAGIAEMSARLATGRLKIFSNLTCWLGEYRQFQRNDKGDPESIAGDHLMKATMLLLSYLPDIAMSENASAVEDTPDFDRPQRDRTTGY